MDIVQKMATKLKPIESIKNTRIEITNNYDVDVQSLIGKE